jgi:hypothetical protein
MGIDRSDRRIDAREQALRFAERVRIHDARAVDHLVRAPPRVDVGEELRRIAPAIDRQAEGRFGDEGVAPHRLERRTRRVVLELVIAGHHAHVAVALDAHLGRSEHVTGGMKRHAHAIERDGLAVFDRLDRSVPDALSRDVLACL